MFMSYVYIEEKDPPLGYVITEGEKRRARGGGGAFKSTSLFYNKKT